VTNRQQRVLEWLSKVFPHEALLFETAIRLSTHTDLPCRARLIAHAYREMCSGLANVNGQTSRTDFKGMIDKVARALGPIGPVIDENLTSGIDPRPRTREPVTVSWKAMTAIRELVAARSAEPKGAARAQALLDRLHERQSAADAAISPTAKRWHDMTETFQRCCHDRESHDSDVMNLLEAEAQFLEETLISFTEGAVENLTALDDILGQANT
jgi:hypothetical protein